MASLSFFLADNVFWLTGNARRRAAKPSVWAAHTGAAAIRPFETFGMCRAVCEHRNVGWHFRAPVLERNGRSLFVCEGRRCGKTSAQNKETD